MLPFIRWYFFRPNPILNPLDTGVVIMSYPANLAVGGVSKKGRFLPSRKWSNLVFPSCHQAKTWLFFVAIELRDGRESSSGESKIYWLNYTCFSSLLLIVFSFKVSTWPRLGSFPPCLQSTDFKKKKFQAKNALVYEHYLSSGFYYIFFWNSLDYVQQPALAQPVSPLPPFLYTHHFFLLPSGQWAKHGSAGNARFGPVTQQFILTWLCKQLPTQPCPPVPSLGHYLSTRLCSVRDSSYHVEGLR